MNLAALQQELGRPAQALASFEQILPIVEKMARDHPESPDFASNLGTTLGNMVTIDLDGRRFDSARDKLTRAVEWQGKALAANPRDPFVRKLLINHLSKLIDAAEGLGRADEVAEARRARDALVAGDPAKAALDARLGEVLKGLLPKDEAERLNLAYRASQKAIHAASARLFAEALANAPKLAEDGRTPHRYNAACAAALAASGQGKDDPKPDDDARAKLRKQALGWLEVELSSRRRVAMTIGPGNKQAVAKSLRHWKVDADLAGIRDAKELARLPDDERAAFQHLWSDVDGLLTKVASGK